MFLFFFVFCFLFFVFCFLFIDNPISSSICELPIRSEIYNCTFKNTNKISIIIIIIVVVVIIFFYYHQYINSNGIQK